MEKFISYEKLSKKEKRKIDQARRQTWGDLYPVTRKPTNSKAYNRNKARNWKRDCQRTNSGTFLHCVLSCFVPFVPERRKAGGPVNRMPIPHYLPFPFKNRKQRSQWAAAPVFLANYSTTSNLFSCLFRAFLADSGTSPPPMPMSISKLKFSTMFHMGCSGPILPPIILLTIAQASGFL